MRNKSALLLGNFLEFYDFTLFAYLIPIISPIIFGNNNDMQAYMMGYVFLAVGFIFRPLGAIIFGHIGDKYGRKIAVLLSISLMAISTTMIGLLPTNFGNVTIVMVLLSLFRIMQGLSAGGEYSGTGLLLIENSECKQQFLNGAFLTASGLLGAFLASMLAALISFFDLSSQYYWRSLFIIGGMVGFLCLWLRIRIPNDKISNQARSDMESSSWRLLFTGHLKAVLLTIFCSALMNVPFQLTTSFLNSFLIATGAFSKSHLMLINSGVVLFCALVTIALGYVTKIVEPIKMMLFASGSIFLFAVPFFAMITSGNVILFILAELVLIFLSQIFAAPAFVALALLFPRHVRYRGMAISNCLGLAIFGGSTSYICALLVSVIGVSWAPVLWLMGVSFAGLCATIGVRGMRNTLDSATYFSSKQLIQNSL